MKLNTSSRRHACTVIALYLLAVLLLAIPMTVAKYESSASGSDTAVIARYDVSMAYGSDAQNLTNTLTLDKIKKPGDTQTFYVKVTNASDVSVSYKVGYVTEDNLPLKVSFSEDDGDTTDDDSTGELGYDNAGNTKVVTVTVEWPAGENNPKYADMVDYLRVVVNFTQMD